jgi:hypothetical protein
MMMFMTLDVKQLAPLGARCGNLPRVAFIGAGQAPSRERSRTMTSSNSKV